MPNVLTVLRMVMAAAAAWLLAADDQRRSLAASLLLVAMLLDFFDGWYARRFRQTTSLGAHLDPFADKMLIAVLFISIAVELRSAWFTLFVAVILARELAITLFRWKVHGKSGTLVPASSLGKLKTVIQCIVGGTLIFYIYIYPAEVPQNRHAVFAAMLLTVFITVDSGLRYLLPRCSDGKKRSVTERLIQYVFGIGAREV